MVVNRYRWAAVSTSFVNAASRKLSLWPSRVIYYCVHANYSFTIAGKRILPTSSRGLLSGL
jgi:hypothetical protein